MEGWVLGTLRAHRQTQDLYDHIAYWAPAQSLTEVDFILTRYRERLVIEVKAATRYSTSMLKGLRAIEDLPHLNRRILIYNGPRAFRTEDGIEVWPLPEFHHALTDNSLWP